MVKPGGIKSIAYEEYERVELGNDCENRQKETIREARVMGEPDREPQGGPRLNERRNYK